MPYGLGCGQGFVSELNIVLVGAVVDNTSDESDEDKDRHFDESGGSCSLFILIVWPTPQARVKGGLHHLTEL